MPLSNSRTASQVCERLVREHIRELARPVRWATATIAKEAEDSVDRASAPRLAGPRIPAVDLKPQNRPLVI